MDDDTKAIAIGLGAGLGGFFGLLILGCICWQICCGSWLEKKTSDSMIRSIPLKNRQQSTPTRNLTNNAMYNNSVTGTQLKTKFSDYSLGSTNDLASKVKSAHR